VPNPSRPRLRFSLLGLLTFVTLACILLAWWVQPNYVVATALFQVSREPVVFLSDEAPRAVDEREFETVRSTQQALLNSHYVLQSAMRKPGVPGLPFLRDKPDAVAWLQDNLVVEYPHDAEILAIRLRGPEVYAADLVQIVDAVAKAYEEEVVFEAHQSRLGTRDLNAASLKKIENEISRKMQELIDLDTESEGKIKDTVDGRMRQEEIDILLEQWRELSRSLERVDIELNAPRRIRKIQGAVISPD